MCLTKSAFPVQPPFLIIFDVPIFEPPSFDPHRTVLPLSQKLFFWRLLSSGELPRPAGRRRTKLDMSAWDYVHYMQQTPVETMPL